MNNKPKNWHIWDFPDNLYVLLKKEVHKEFFSEMFNKCGGKRPYARFLKVPQMQMKNYWKRYTKKNNKKYIQYIPLWIFKRSKYLMNKKLIAKVENGIEKIRVRAGNPINSLKLPIIESPELYSIVAHLIGDGFAGKRKVPYYANTCTELRNQFKKDLQIFGKIKTYETIPNTTPIVNFPKVISDVLRHIFNIEFIRPSKLPKKIHSASEECKCAFIQALFDDEGYISSSLGLLMQKKCIVDEIKKLMENLGIKINGTYKAGKYFRIEVNPKYYPSYKSKINFIHPIKLNNLKFALKTKERNKIQRTRPLEETRKKIIDLLKEKPRSTLEIANNLLFTVGGLYLHLKVLEKTKKIKRNGYKNKIIWSLV